MTDRQSDSYFAIVFASQSKPKRPSLTHVFASVVKASIVDCEPQHADLEVHTISWMPQAMNIRLLRRTPEPGVNLGLHDTLKWAAKTDQHVSAWGPWSVDPHVYWRVLRRINELRSGSVQYRCIDPIFHRSDIADCIHAVSDIDPTQGRIWYPLLRFGHSAGLWIARNLVQSGAVIRPEVTHQWLPQRMGLTDYEIDYPPITTRLRDFISRGLLSKRKRLILDSQPIVPAILPEPDFECASIDPQIRQLSVCSADCRHSIGR